MKLQEQVYNALLGALNVTVVEYNSEYDGEYPVVVYSETANEPVLFADDSEVLRRVIYQISIGTADDMYDDLTRATTTVMNELGFTRIRTDGVQSNGVYWREIKFSKIVMGGM